MQIDENRNPGIKAWSPEDRPREKMLAKGLSSLSDAELLSILIGTGTAKASAVELSRRILVSCDHQLHTLARLSVNDLTRVKGIGPAKAITIVAALELGRRRKETDRAEKPKIDGSSKAFQELKSEMMDLPHEEFWVLFLNRANRLIRKKKISEGGVSGTVADPKIIFKHALEDLASGMIVAHNHPSGNLTASTSDIELTRKIKEGARLLEMQLLDHLIISGEKYLSFADEGML